MTATYSGIVEKYRMVVTHVLHTLSINHWPSSDGKGSLEAYGLKGNASLHSSFEEAEHSYTVCLLVVQVCTCKTQPTKITTCESDLLV